MNARDDGKPLTRLTNDIVDELLELSDEEVLALSREAGDDPADIANRLRAQFDQTLLAVNKTRLVTARAAMHSRREHAKRKPEIGVELARRLWDQLIREKGKHAAMTLAARNETELSDADVLGIIQDLCELNIIAFPESGAGD